MGDFIDRISEGHKRTCPMKDCDYVAEDLNPEVAVGLLNNHLQRKHKES